jgi:hypothetical protein
LFEPLPFGWANMSSQLPGIYRTNIAWVYVWAKRGRLADGLEVQGNEHLFSPDNLKKKKPEEIFSLQAP